MSSSVLSAINFKKLSQLNQRKYDTGSADNNTQAIDEMIQSSNENCLKSKLNNSLKTMNMLNILRKNRQLYDVILQIDDNHNDIYCHQVILACNSKLFMELLLDTEIECSNNENERAQNDQYHKTTDETEFVTYSSSNRKIIIKLEPYLKQFDYKLSENTYDALKACINFMYTFEIDLNLGNLSFIKEVYCLSIQLSINSLITRCSKFLIQNLNDINCLTIRTFALDTFLISSSTEYIKQYMRKLIYLKEFQQLPRVNIELVGYCCDTTEILNDLLLKWLLNNVDEKHEILNNLCENINILYLNDDKSLHDCCDMDSENKNYSDYINDYQKKGYHQPQQYNVNIELQQNLNEIISTYQTNDNNFIAICIVNGNLLTLSVHLQVTPAPTVESVTQAIEILKKSPSITDPVGYVTNDEFNGSDTSSSPDRDSDELIKKYEIQRLVEIKNGFSKLTKMVSSRCSHGLVSINKKLYIIGGYDRGECLTKCEIYDPIENKFQSFDSLNNRRGRSATIYIEKLNSIVVFGGSNGHRELNSLEKYDFNLNKWTSIPFEVSFDCVNVGITTDDDYVYLVGIHDSKAHKPIHCLKYEPISNTFQCISDLNSGNYF